MKQKVWLITGVSKGLGREIAKQVVATGDIVIGTVRNKEDKVAFENGVDAKAFIIDLAETKLIPTLINSIIKEHGQIDVLVNNAGFGAFGMIEEFDEEEVTNQFNVNVIAVWKLCQSVLPFMRDKGQGTIVQISSRVAITAGIGNGIYASSKFALEGMSEAMKQEVETFGIKVMLAELGALRTDFFGASVKYAKNSLPFYTEKLTDITVLYNVVILTDYAQNCIVISAYVGEIVRYFQFATAYLDAVGCFDNTRTFGKQWGFYDFVI